MILVGTLILKMLSNNVIHFCTYYLELKPLSFQNRKRFYNDYILPQFDFCFVICYLGYLYFSHGRQTCKTSKRAARAILHVDFSVPSETMFTQLKWMIFPERVVYHKAIQMYKTVCGDAPDYLKMILHLRFIQDY